jgi:hypothetical protein
MKRDMDLCRKILIEIEKLPFEPGWNTIEVDGYSEENIVYHVYLLYDAGLIDARDVSAGNKSTWYPVCIRWEGQEFLASSRDEGIWKKANTIAGKVGGVALPVLSQILTSLVKQELNLP